MNALDLIIILLTIAVAVRGVAHGLLRQAGSLGGFLLGLVGGAMLAPVVLDIFPSASNQVFIVLLIVFGAAFVVGSAGEALGSYLSGLAERNRLQSLDGVLGAAFGIVVTLFSVWVLAATFSRSAGPVWAMQISQSRILSGLDQTLPPAPQVLARLDRFLGAGRIPRVFTGLEPTPAAPLTGPNAAAVNAAAAAGRASTVKVEGAGCGGVVDGSGFVAGPGLVATNAHVVAGIDAPFVIDTAGRHRAQVVVFNPKLDFAVLRTSGLAGAVLPLAEGASPRGTVGAALGYPGGGNFTVSGATVLARQTALGRDIYDQGLVRRDIYALQAVVRPGNSGGPLVTPDGTVVGVVFATSTTDGNLGYALTSAEVLPFVRAAATAGAVSSGACIAE